MLARSPASGLRDLTLDARRAVLGADAAGDADDVGDSEAPPLADLEGARRGLEDLLVLYGEEEETDAGADDQLGGSDDDAAPA